MLYVRSQKPIYEYSTYLYISINDMNVNMCCMSAHSPCQNRYPNIGVYVVNIKIIFNLTREHQVVAMPVALTRPNQVYMLCSFNVHEKSNLFESWASYIVALVKREREHNSIYFRQFFNCEVTFEKLFSHEKAHSK